LQIDLFELEPTLLNRHIVQRRHIGHLLMVGFHKVIVIVTRLVKVLMIMIEHYISLLEVVFILRFSKEEVVLELSSCYRKILPPGCLFFFQIIYCPL